MLDYLALEPLCFHITSSYAVGRMAQSSFLSAGHATEW